MCANQLLPDLHLKLLFQISFFGAASIAAAELTSPGFENDEGWQLESNGDALIPEIDDQESQEGTRSFKVSLPNGTPTNDEDFAGVSQVVELSRETKGLSFAVKDDYTGKTAGYYWLEVLLDDQVIWEADVAGGDLEWRRVSLDLSRYLEEPKR